MRKLGLLVAILAGLIWSGVVWGGYLLLAGAGAFVAHNAGAVGLPSEFAEVAAWAQLLFDSFGQGAAIVLWLLGLGFIGVLFLIVTALAGLGSPSKPRREEQQPRQIPPEPRVPPARGSPVWGRDASRR